MEIARNQMKARNAAWRGRAWPAWLAWLALALVGMSLRSMGQRTPSAPDRMTYQGYLRRADGSAAGAPAPKAYDMVFRIFDAATSGNLVWAERQMAVVDNGYFAVQLGEGDPVDGFSNPTGGLAAAFGDPSGGARWVELTVNGFAAGGGNLTVTPRVQLLSAPYAYLAQSAAALVDSSGSTFLSLTPGSLVVSKPLTATAINVPTLTVGTLTVSNNLTIGTSGGGGGFLRTPDGALRVVSGRHRWTNGYPSQTTLLLEPSPGYSVTRVSKGEYKVTFDSPFNSVPTVTATTITPMVAPPSQYDGNIGTAYCQVHQSTDPTTARREFSVRFYTLQQQGADKLYYMTSIPGLGEFPKLDNGQLRLQQVYYYSTTLLIDWDFAFVAAGT